MIAAVYIADVTHNSGERLCVGLHRRGAQGTENLDLVSGAFNHARKTLRVRFNPKRSVAGHAIFPTRKPEKNDVQPFLACMLEQSIHQREIVLAFSRLNQFPGQRCEYSIQGNLRQPRPDRFHVIETRRTGIVNLGAKNQKRLAIYD
jgi:hypothetical protein